MHVLEIILYTLKDSVISEHYTNIYQLKEGIIHPGEVLPVQLPKNTTQLSNKSRLIRLID